MTGKCQAFDAQGGRRCRNKAVSIAPHGKASGIHGIRRSRQELCAKHAHWFALEMVENHQRLIWALIELGYLAPPEEAA